MNKAQKIAWFTLAVVIAGSVLVTVLAVLEAVKLMLAVSLGIFAIVGISPLLFRKKGGHIEFDERDMLIRIRASLVASGASFGCLIAQCVRLVFQVGPRGTVQVIGLVVLVYGALVCFVITKSIYTLFEYRYGKK